MHQGVILLFIKSLVDYSKLGDLLELKKGRYYLLFSKDMTGYSYDGNRRNRSVIDSSGQIRTVYQRELHTFFGL